LETILRSTESLATFVADCRYVSDRPERWLAPVSLTEMFARVERLVASGRAARGGVTA